MTEKPINNEYEKLIQHVLENGVHKQDRTGTGTTSVFGYQMRFNIEKEGFPLITTKKLHTKSIIHELLWFLNGDTNVKYLQDNGVRIWNEWQRDNGDLGPVYGASWRAIYAPARYAIQVPTQEDRDANFEYPFTTQIFDPIDCDLNDNHMWAIEDLGTKTKNRRYKVQLSSGFIINEISRPNWKSIKKKNSFSTVDGYAKTVANTGFTGKFVAHDERTYNTWQSMMNRCYNENHPSYKFYGAKGVTVSPVWHSFEYFVATLNRVPGYYNWRDSVDFELDKDYTGSKVYSPTTCVFINKKDNTSILQDGNAVEIEGKIYVSYTDWALGNGKTASYAKSRWDKGLSYKGIPASAVKIVPPKEGHLWRNRLFIDQIAEVIEQIKSNPDSRRLIVSAWNPPALPFQELPPCHSFIQFYVANGKLSCQLYQRSGDIFLGIPYNISSYSALLCAMAAETDLEPGEFIHSIGDAHIYDNHLEQVKLQLSRDVRPFPTLKLKKAKDIFSYKFEDFVIEGYDPHPHIPGLVAV